MPTVTCPLCGRRVELSAADYASPTRRCPRCHRAFRQSDEEEHARGHGGPADVPAPRPAAPAGPARWYHSWAQVLVVLTAGVFVGNMLSTLVTAAIIKAQVGAALKELKKDAAPPR
jgi:hypothetical protein